MSSGPDGAARDLAAIGDGTTQPWLGRLAYWSAVSALASIVPVPFLDEHLVRVTRRAMVRELLEEHGLVLQEVEVRYLAGPGRRLDWGCVIAAAIALVVKATLAIVKRLFRTLFFWLAVHDASKAATFTFHEGFLLRRALAALPPVDPAAAPPRLEIVRLRERVEQVVAEVDPKPLRSAFRVALRGSWGVLRAAARRSRRLLLGVREEEVEALRLEQVTPPKLVERLIRAVVAQGPYLEDLTRRMDRALADPVGQVEDATASPQEGA